MPSNISANDPFAGPSSSALQEINKPGLFSSTLPTLNPSMSGRAFFAAGSNVPTFNSLTEEIVNMTQSAFFDANVEIGGNLQVDGLFSTGLSGTISSLSLNINPGPLTVTGSGNTFGCLALFTQQATGMVVPGVAMVGQAIGDALFGSEVAGDTNPRFRINADGSYLYGTGSANLDVKVQRGGVSTLQLTAAGSGNPPQFLVAPTVSGTIPTFQVVSHASGDPAYGAQVSGDAVYRWTVDSNGKQLWGTGSTGADTQLARSSVGTLTLQPVSASNAGGMIITAKGSSQTILTILNTAPTPAVPSAQISAASAGDRAFGILVTGDGFQRWKTDSTGLLQWGAGTATQDTNLYRLGAGTLRTDNSFSVGGTIFGGADTTASDIQPDGIVNSGSTGKLADAGHVHQEFALQSLYLAPTGADAETMTRGQANVNAGPLGATSGIFMRAIALQKNLVVNNITFDVGTTAASGVTHGWYGITDSNRVVKATSADQGSTTIWGTTSTLVTLGMSSAFTVPTAGLYYIGLSLTASTLPTIAGAGNLAAGLAGNAPFLYGQAGTSSTPPTIGSTLSTFSVNNGFNIYGYTS